MGRGCGWSLTLRRVGTSPGPSCIRRHVFRGDWNCSFFDPETVEIHGKQFAGEHAMGNSDGDGERPRRYVYLKVEWFISSDDRGARPGEDPSTQGIEMIKAMVRIVMAMVMVMVTYQDEYKSTLMCITSI